MQMYTAIYTHSFQATKTQEKFEEAHNILQANLTDWNSRAKLTYLPRASLKSHDLLR